jgi:hypothetical protein
MRVLKLVRGTSEKRSGFFFYKQSTFRFYVNAKFNCFAFNFTLVFWFLQMDTEDTINNHEMISTLKSELAALQFKRDRLMSEVK